MPRAASREVTPGDLPAEARRAERSSRLESRWTAASPVAPSASEGARSHPQAPPLSQQFAPGTAPAGPPASSHSGEAQARLHLSLLPEASPKCTPDAGEHRGGCQQRRIAGLAPWRRFCQNCHHLRWRRCSRLVCPENQWRPAKQQLLPSGPPRVHQGGQPSRRAKAAPHVHSEFVPVADGQHRPNGWTRRKPQPGARARSECTRRVLAGQRNQGIGIIRHQPRRGGPTVWGLSLTGSQKRLPPGPGQCAAVRTVAALSWSTGECWGAANAATCGPAAKEGSLLWRRRSSRRAGAHRPRPATLLGAIKASPSTPGRRNPSESSWANRVSSAVGLD